MTPDTLRAALDQIEGRLAGRIPYDDLLGYRDELLNIARAALQGDADAPQKTRRIDWSNVVVDEGDEAP